MKLTSQNIFAFLLMITGSMAVGSMYSVYLNHPAVPLTSANVVLTSMMFLFVFSGYYSFNYLTEGRGKLNVALGLNIFLFVLTAWAFSQGYDRNTQKWFSVHEVLNLLLTFVLSIQLLRLRMSRK